MKLTTNVDLEMKIDGRPAPLKFENVLAVAFRAGQKHYPGPAGFFREMRMPADLFIPTDLKKKNERMLSNNRSFSTSSEELAYTEIYCSDIV
jgi:hypothetical protein